MRREAFSKALTFLVVTLAAAPEARAQIGLVEAQEMAVTATRAKIASDLDAARVALARARAEIELSVARGERSEEDRATAEARIQAIEDRLDALASD